MTTEVRVPRLAESISEAVLVEWLKPDGARVEVDEPIAILETDKAAVEIAAQERGVLHHLRQVQDRVHVDDAIARIESDGAGAGNEHARGAPAGSATSAPTRVPASASAAPATLAPTRAPASASAAGPAPAPPATPARPSSPAPAPPAPAVDEAPDPDPDPRSAGAPAGAPPRFGPAVRRLIEENGLDPSRIPATGLGGRLLREDVLQYLEARAGGAPATPAAAAAPAPAPAPSPAAPSAPGPAAPPTASRSVTPDEERVVPMSPIRQRIAERLVRSQHTAAILTTFNEIDMSAVLDLRARHRESFEKRHGVRLGFLSFFGRAVTLALAEIPVLNAEIRGTDIVYRTHVHLGIAVQTERGLVVPVVRGADRLSFAEIEREIARLAERARANRLTLDELSGGTFTISNGGVFGSLLSTPILNPPQSGILGMHKIEKRPVVVEDAIVIRPMMYVALSYDHRIVDGEQAVTFLVRVKERLEDPERMMLDV